ncbi:MAG: alpha-amylase family glycosyl hydrolase [Bacteroidales bacterium]|nr:alpha-amylase family glycosyl hydrolase [Bacteroidales bacterium]
MSVDPTDLYFTKDASSQTITVDTNAEQWTVTITENGDWFSIDKTSGSGSGVLTVTVNENKTGEDRKAGFKISAPAFKTANITITQLAGDELINPSATGLFSIPELPDADESCILYYRADSKSPFYNYTKDMYAHIGIVEAEWMFVQAQWNENIAKCKWQPCQEKNLWKLPIEPSIREWFSSEDTPVNKIGVVVRSSDGGTQTEDLFVKVQDTKFIFEPDPVVKETMPAGLSHGINYNADGSVSLVLYDKDKFGKYHEYCYVVGDFSGWKRQSEYAMKRDEAAGCWWYTFTNVNPDEEYLFQYYVGSADGSAFRVHDPYTEIVYDGSNDKYISSTTYPGLREYPSGTSGLVSAFKVNRDNYSWKVNNYKVEDIDDLVIYEMHFRDFTQSGDIAGALEKMDYLDALGVNAVEVMPVQEFDGNDSWGYNPCSYFALDKAYGSREMYKKFIDECHSRGMAVIVDVVYNHLTGAHPYAKLYWDSASNKTAANNPWFNVDAPHPYSVYHDLNHENEMVRDHVKKSLEYLLKEYKVDGFRFDLTKGFTSKSCTEATASNYDQSRINILKEYISTVKAINPDAVVILEHFCETREENELAKAGAKVWRNLNHAYCQAAMGYSDSSFGGLWTGTAMPFGSYVGYMESHDEERTAFKSEAYGITGIKGNLDVRMLREALNAAFFLTVPGPKMLWQFEELGYDISIDENGRTGRKPIHWDYYEVSQRKALYDTYCSLIKFRNENPRFFDSDASFSWNVTGWDNGRSITCTADGKSFAVIGNFTTATKNISVSLPSDGQWKDYEAFGSQTYDVPSDKKLTISLKPAEFRLIVK